MTRKLDSKYKDLVEFINSRSEHTPLSDILSDFLDGHSDIDDVAEWLDVDGTDASSVDEFISIIVDVYNDNYELEEPKYYVKLPKMSFPYVSLNKDGFYDVYSEKNDKTKQEFTMSEIEAIDPRYKAFAIPVEDNADE